MARTEVLCLGVTVLTGPPIRDALRVTQAVRVARPDLPIVWGGWHPSLFPQDTLTEAGLDAVVVGQGEDAFAEIVDRLAAREELTGIPGTVSIRPDRHGTGEIVRGAPRPLAPLDRLPEHDYSLVDVERYFAMKRQRQVDYVSSQGCRFRCAFCADPSVFDRSWTGLDPARVGSELETLARHHSITDVGFQDETFFTHAPRVAALADEFLRRGLRFTWMATMRADQGDRLDEAILASCRRAGLRRVMIGLESGSQRMLDWMQKDIKLDQVFTAADKCRRLGIAVLFNLIVGFPDEPPESIDETLAVARRLRALGPEFEIAMFYYQPYPGTAITDTLARQGYPLPQSLDRWADIDSDRTKSPWVDRRTQRRVERFTFYQRIGWARATALRAPLQAVARWRCHRDRFALPIEKAVVEWLRPGVPS